LRINNTLSGIGVAIGKVKVRGINEGDQAGGVGAFIAAGVAAAKVNQRIKLLDGRQAPIVVATEVERACPGNGPS
jgi:hypothetical protein